MENTDERFDKMMRGAFSGIGTSAAFTRRLMVRIGQEKEVARARRIRRRSTVAAIGLFLLALVSFVLLVTCFRAEQMFSNDYWSGLVERIGQFFSDLLSGVRISSVVHMVVVSLGVFAVLSWDAVLRIFYTRQK